MTMSGWLSSRSSIIKNLMTGGEKSRAMRSRLDETEDRQPCKRLKAACQSYLYRPKSQITLPQLALQCVRRTTASVLSPHPTTAC